MPAEFAVKRSKSSRKEGLGRQDREGQPSMTVRWTDVRRAVGLDSVGPEACI